MTMHTIAQIELFGIWLIWAWPYLFRAPKVQARKSITVAVPSRIGLLLQAFGLFAVWWFRAPGGLRVSVPAMLAALILGALANVLMWSAIPNLGRQFRIHAGLYEDHELVRSGPYAVVRHPIYASVVALTLATGILISPWQWIAVGTALCIAGSEIRIYTEDRLLESRFGDQFRKYQKKVSAYLPFVR
jgi:protein-S-isoprenylcysteine O-methyltransferase Ste14